MCDINRELRLAAAKVDPEVDVPRLLVNDRGIGIRLNWDLEMDGPRNG